MKKISLLFILLTFGMSINVAAQKKADGEIRLIVRGDDIGSSHAANVACIQSYREGIMRTVEVMVPCPWFPEAVKMLNENPGLDVGIHLAITSEWQYYKWRPLTYCPSLVDENGYFYPMIWRRDDFPPNTALREANWKIDEIEQEFRAQIEMALKKIPQVSHISCHMACSNWDDEVNQVYQKLAQEYDLDIVPSDYGVQPVGGFGDASTVDARIEKFIEILENLQAGTYLFVDHPGLNTPEMQAISHIGYEDVAADRDAVTRVFTSKKVKAVIQKRNIKLIGYADLKKEQK